VSLNHKANLVERPGEELNKEIDEVAE